MPIVISGTQAIVLAVFMLAIFGSLHLLAASHPGNRVSQAYVALGF